MKRYFVCSKHTRSQREKYHYGLINVATIAFTPTVAIQQTANQAKWGFIYLGCDIACWHNGMLQIDYIVVISLWTVTIPSFLGQPANVSNFTNNNNFTDVSLYANVPQCDIAVYNVVLLFLNTKTHDRRPISSAEVLYCWIHQPPKNVLVVCHRVKTNLRYS